jgi:hypothetical protein
MRILNLHCVRTTTDELFLISEGYKLDIICMVLFVEKSSYMKGVNGMIVAGTACIKDQ